MARPFLVRRVGTRRSWLSRRAAYGALARLASTCYIVDGCVPRTKLPEALARTIEIGLAPAPRSGSWSLAPINRIAPTARRQRKPKPATASAVVTFSLYPSSLFGGWTRVLLHVVVPAGLVSWMPAELVTRWHWGQAAAISAVS